MIYTCKKKKSKKFKGSFLITKVYKLRYREWDLNFCLFSDLSTENHKTGMVQLVDLISHGLALKFYIFIEFIENHKYEAYRIILKFPENHPINFSIL